MLFASSAALADSVTLKIRAINPSQFEKQPVDVKAFLPPPAKPEDVINAGELTVSYDVASKTYFVGKTVEMEPGQTRTFEVVVNDIWTVPAGVLKELSDHASMLSASLKSTDKGETAGKLAGLIDENLKAVAARQGANGVGMVKPVDHIRAFEANTEVLGRIRRDIGLLENLAIAAGLDPQRIMGTPKGSPPAETEPGQSTGEVVTVHMKITNPSLTATKTNVLTLDFPVEIKPADVLDAGGLQVGFDAARNVCYVYAEGVPLAPQETKTFDVKVRNPWTDILLKIPKLELRASEVVKLTKDEEKFKAIAGQAQDILKDIEAIKAQKLPEEINEQYIAFARGRQEAVRGVEARIMRLEELFQPGERPMKWGVPAMDIPRPDRRTTWVIIYIILAFLALFSVFFFFRWYGRTKEEQLHRETAVGDKSSGSGNSPSGESKP
jgi:hypothetical protein